MDQVVAFKVKVDACFMEQIVIYLMNGAVDLEVDEHGIKLIIAMDLKPIAIKIA